MPDLTDQEIPMAVEHEFQKKLDRIYELVSYLQPSTQEDQDCVKEIMELCEE